MRGFLDFSNNIFQAIITFGKIWWLGILWLITSLPVITIGASTTALIYACMKLHKDEGYPTANFFRSFKMNFRQGTAIWIIYLIFGMLLGYALIFWNQVRNTAAWYVILMISIPYLISLMYVFAILSKFINTVRNTILYSLILPCRHLKETALMAVTIAAVIYFNVTGSVLINFITIIFGPGLIVYLFSVYYINIFQKYIPGEDAEESGTGSN